MTLQTEFIQLKCEGYGEFLTKVNRRLHELGDSVVSVDFIYAHYDLLAIITLRVPNQKEVEELIKKYTKEDKQLK